MASVEIEVKSGGAEIEKPEKEYGDYDKWEIENAMRTIMEAEEIKADKEKMKYVSMCMKEKADQMQGTIKSLDQLKAVAKKKMEKMEEDE